MAEKIETKRMLANTFMQNYLMYSIKNTKAVLKQYW